MMLGWSISPTKMPSMCWSGFRPSPFLAAGAVLLLLWKVLVTGATDYMYFQDMYWEDLPPEARDAAIILGFDETSWDLDEHISSYDKGYLSPQEARAVTLLGLEDLFIAVGRAGEDHEEEEEVEEQPYQDWKWTPLLDEELRWTYTAEDDHSRHWKGRPVATKLGVDVGIDIQNCLDEEVRILTAATGAYAAEGGVTGVAGAAHASPEKTAVRARDVHYSNEWSRDTPILVAVDPALSKEDAASVQALARCTRRYLGHEDGWDMFERRSFDASEGGNDCTFMNPLLQRYLPGVAGRVVEAARVAWERAAWAEQLAFGESKGDDEDEDEGKVFVEFPDPVGLGFRTVEHLAYGPTQSFSGLGKHEDSESVYTVAISLSDPSDYEGGEFFVESWDEEVGCTNVEECRTYFKPPRLSALVFLSDHTTHGVNPVRSGHRETFVTELWRQDDPPLGYRRPSLKDWTQFLWEHQTYDHDDGCDNDDCNSHAKENERRTCNSAHEDSAQEGKTEL